MSEKAVLEGVVSHHGFHCIMKLTHQELNQKRDITNNFKHGLYSRRKEKKKGGGGGRYTRW